MQGIIIFFLIICFNFSCSTYKTNSNRCQERNAVIEYGTSRIKYLLAERNICEKQDLKILNKTEWELDTMKGHLETSDGQITFHSTVKDELKTISNQISVISKNFKVKKVHGIASGIYRSLYQRQEIFQELEKIIESKILVLSVAEEVNIGILAIVSTEKPPKHFIVWDFGGNSMQLSIIREGGVVQSVTSLPGSNEIRLKVSKKLKKKDTPNPIGLKNIRSLKQYLKNSFASSLKPLIGTSDIEIFGIGGVHLKSVATPIFHLLNDSTAKKVYSRDQLDQLLNFLAKSTDLQIGGKFPEDQATNVLAVQTVMDHLGWKKIRVSDHTLALGYLLSRP